MSRTALRRVPLCQAHRGGASFALRKAVVAARPVHQPVTRVRRHVNDRFRLFAEKETVASSSSGRPHVAEDV